MTTHNLWFFWTGRGQTNTREGVVQLRPGVCVWCKPGWSYYTTWDAKDPIGNYFMYFDLVDARGRPLPNSTPLPPDFIMPHDANLVEAVVHRIVHLVLHGDSHVLYADVPETGVVHDVATALLTGLLMDLDAGSDPEHSLSEPVAPQQRQRMLEAATRVIESPETAPRIATLARKHSYSADHFTRLFKKATGHTPKQFAVRTRIQRAQELLIHSSQSVKEIGEAMGYQNIYHFSAQFKKLTGMSPTQFRRNAPKPRLNSA